MVNGKHFTPAVADLVDSVTIPHRSAAYQLIEAWQKHFLLLREELVSTVFCLERVHSMLIHMLHKTSRQLSLPTSQIYLHYSCI